MLYSHAPQLMGYVDCEEGYEWFAYFCIVGGIILSIATAPNLLPLLGKYLVSFAKAMVATGPRVASALLNLLKSALKVVSSWWKGLPVEKQARIVRAILAALLAIAAHVLSTQKDIDVPMDEEKGDIIYRGGKEVGTRTIIDEKPGYEEGIVILFNDIYDDNDNMTYVYRFYEGVFWVWSDEKGDWVQQPTGWEPGDEPQLP